MMYQIHEWQKCIAQPIFEASSTAAHLFQHPLSPFAYLPNSRDISAGATLLTRLTKQYTKPEFGIKSVTIDGQEVPISETVAHQKTFCSLLCFQKETIGHNDPILLIVAPMSGHYATLLRDTVRTCLQHYTVYITDWIDAKLVPVYLGPWHLQDYVQYVIDFLEFLGKRVHIMSVCQPTVPVLAAVSLLAARGSPHVPKTGVFMGGPIDARRNPTNVNNLAQKKSFDWFKSHVIYQVPFPYPGMARKVYPGFLQYGGFVLMNVDRHAAAHRQFFMHLVHGDGSSTASHMRFYDEYNAVMDLPAEYYLDTIKAVFQNFDLPNNRMKFFGELVEPAEVKNMRLLTVEGEFDDISGFGQTAAAHELCSGIMKKNKKHITAQGVGHYGIFSGTKWRKVLFPEVHSFIQNTPTP